MKTITYYILILIAAILLTSLTCSAQDNQEEDCAFKLQEAEKLYSQGLIEEIPILLGDCIKKGFSKEDRLQAYKLLILVYLFDDQQKKADSAMLAFLKKYPEYQIVPTDPANFEQLYNGFRVTPRFAIGLTFGGNYSYAQVTEYFGIQNLNGIKPLYYPGQMGFQIGGKLNFAIYQDIRINIEALYTTRTFGYELAEPIPSMSYFSYYENITSIDVPVIATYDFDLDKWFVPYAGVGLRTGFLINAVGSSEMNYLESGTIERVEKKILDQRKSIYYWLVVNGGTKIKVPMGYVNVDLCYNFGLLNLINPDKRYADPSLSFDYYHVDDNLRLNNFFFSIGWIYTFYKPSKK